MLPCRKETFCQALSILTLSSVFKDAEMSVLFFAYLICSARLRAL